MLLSHKKKLVPVSSLTAQPMSLYAPCLCMSLHTNDRGRIYAPFLNKLYFSSFAPCLYIVVAIRSLSIQIRRWQGLNKNSSTFLTQVKVNFVPVSSSGGLRCSQTPGLHMCLTGTLAVPRGTPRYCLCGSAPDTDTPFFDPKR